MARFVIKRLLSAVLTLWAITTATFLIFFALPASPGQAMCSKNCDPRTVAAIEKSLGLDQPLIVQYANYHRGILLGRDFERQGVERVHCPAPCLGYSFRTNEPVTDIMGRALPVTLSIVVGAAVIWLGVGISLGIFSALRHGTILDRSAVGFSLTAASLPVYVNALLLMVIFVFTLNVLPMATYVSPIDNPGAWARGMVLPWLAVAFVQSAQYARLSRSQMLETLTEDFVRTARAIGLRRRTVYLRHALRAAITPIVTVAGIDIGTALGGVAITETIFGLKGLGWYAASAVPTLNLPVIMATVIVAAVFIVAANAIVDCAYALIDPRVKLR